MFEVSAKETFAAGQALRGYQGKCENPHGHYPDHQFLNDLAPFDVLNPSAENLARYFYEESERLLAERHLESGARVAAVRSGKPTPPRPPIGD